MKRLIIILIAACFLFTVASCGSNKVMNGIEYETYGIFNKEEVRKEGVRYRLVIGNDAYSEHQRSVNTRIILKIRIARMWNNV